MCVCVSLVIFLFSSPQIGESKMDKTKFQLVYDVATLVKKFGWAKAAAPFLYNYIGWGNNQNENTFVWFCLPTFFFFACVGLARCSRARSSRRHSTTSRLARQLRHRLKSRPLRLLAASVSPTRRPRLTLPSRASWLHNSRPSRPSGWSDTHALDLAGRTRRGPGGRERRRG